jgi:NADH:ubiquinone oxidoreductase subunit E
VAFTRENRARATEIMERYPFKKSATLPLLHLAQEQDGWVSPEAMREIAAMLDVTPAQILGICSFYTMLKREPVGRYVVSVCTNVTCLVRGGPELLEHLEGRHGDDSDVHVEEVECIGACDRAPVFQLNYDFHGPVTHDEADAIIDEYVLGNRPARSVSGTAVGGG